MRRLIHTRHPALTCCGLRLGTLAQWQTGEPVLLDCRWKNTVPSSKVEEENKISFQQALLCFRFLNSEMYYTKGEVEMLREALDGTALLSTSSGRSWLIHRLIHLFTY